MHTRTYILNALFQTLAAVALLGSPVSTCSLPFHAHPLKHGSISFPIRLSFRHFPRLTLVSANSRRISFSSSTKRFRPQLGSFHDEIGQVELHISCKPWTFPGKLSVFMSSSDLLLYSYLQIQWTQKCWKLSMLSLHKLVWQSQSVHFDLLYNSLQFSNLLSISSPGESMQPRNLWQLGRASDSCLPPNEDLRCGRWHQGAGWSDHPTPRWSSPTGR